MHFVGMLALTLSATTVLDGVSITLPNINFGYNISFTVISLFAIVIAARAGIAISFGDHSSKVSSRVERLPLAQPSTLSTPHLDSVRSRPAFATGLGSARSSRTCATGISENAAAASPATKPPVSLRHWLKELFSPQNHTSYARLALSGFVVGGGVCVMHYLGMLAMKSGQVEHQHWHPAYVCLSVICAVGVSCVGFFLLDRFQGPFWNIAVAFVLTGAVLTMHYTGMLSVSYSVRQAAFLETAGIAPRESSSSVTTSQLAFAISLASFFTSFVLIGVVALVAGRAREELERRVKLRTAEVEQERKKSEMLLFNVLPKRVALRTRQRLAIGEGSSAYTLTQIGIEDSEKFDYATVIFADIVGFTTLASKLSAPAVVGILNEIFSSFDAECEIRGVEKIKTIGDAYLAAACIQPQVNKERGAEGARQAVSAAFAMLDTITRFAENHSDLPVLQIRVGVHTGPIAAGVIGTTRVCYDIWGDTVNVASRMESTGLPGHVQVSGITHSYLSHDNRLWVEKKTYVKGKGEMTTFVAPGRAHWDAPSAV